MKTFHQGWLERTAAVCVTCFLFLYIVMFSPGAFAAGGARPRPVEDSWDQHRPPATASPRPSPGRFDLLMLSYNIHGLPLDVGVDHSRYADIGRILAQRRQAGNAPQLVMIQEAFHPRTEDLVTQAGYPYVARGAPSQGVRAPSGLIILSTFPLSKVSWKVYDFCTSWDCWARKGVLHVNVAVPGLARGLDVYSTHLNSDPDTDFWTPSEEAQQARMTQMQEMREFIWETKASGNPMLASGDFNFRKGDDDYESFTSLLLVQDTADICGGNSRCIGYDVARDYASQAIDHHFYDPGSTSVRMAPTSFARVFREPVNGRLLSDHDGVETKLSISW